ncbi:MAG: DUF2066 domain-containing protein [Rhizobiales bacterium]|nr:DUF2066 domain-containing protein [Hyphomicrobiales bacterium]
MPAGGRLLPALFLLVAAACPGRAAETVPDLYRVSVLVTGQGAETRGPALERAFGAVLVKVSGDPALAGAPVLAPLAADAADYVEGFSYRDLMAGIPVHDEQGSRDRPYELTVRFVPDRIDAALAALGEAPWTGPRPELLAVVDVETGGTRFTLAADGAKGRDMREALAAAAAQYGLAVSLPDAAALASGAAPMAMARAAGADRALTGTLAWDDAALGWTAAFRMTTDDGATLAWAVRQVSFDQAFRAAIGGAAQALSGHGSP